MALVVDEERMGKEREDLTQDGSVDRKGRPCVRSRGGRWTACSFIVGYEVFERMSFYGIVSNLVTYLTTKLHQGTVSSANNVTNWSGTVWLMPILGAYVADAHLGRYWTFVIASGIYLLGMCLLTLSVSLLARPPPCSGGHAGEGCDSRATAFQVGIFYCALYTIALGTGGTKPNISTMGADQFDESDPEERTQKLSFFNWWIFSIFIGTLIAYTAVVYIQDNVGWALGYGLPTAGLAVSILVFLVGTPFYRHKPPAGSPFTRMARVIVAAMRKWRVPNHDDPKDLHELDLEEYAKDGKIRIDHSPSLRFLDKAAVKKSGWNTPWTLCPVTQVEETKQMLKMLPVLAATLVPSMMLAQVHTLFIKQGTTMDRSMGPHFSIPPASLPVFVTLSTLASLVAYDRLLVPFARRRTGNPRGFTLLQRLGVGLALQVLVMATAALAERRRLGVAREQGVTDAKATVPLSVFVLLPQFALTGVAETFLEVARLEFFYDQAPGDMKSLGTSYVMTSYGVGNFLSSFLLATASKLTKRNGSHGWIQDNLNTSHLDYYYGLLAVLSVLNLLWFLGISSSYVYNASGAAKSGIDLIEERSDLPANKLAEQ